MRDKYLARLTISSVVAALVLGAMPVRFVRAEAAIGLEPQPAPAAPTAQEDADWLVMLYQNADDEVLEGDIYTDLNEAELIGSTDEVIIVSQFDRFEGAFDGDGDWTDAKRILVTQDDDLAAVNSEVLEELGEIDSGSPETLAEFAIWAITNFPAKKYALVLSDHGAGWVGGWNDNAPEEGSALSVDEIDQALAYVIAETGIGQLEFIGFDACLMSQVEALSSVAPYAKYAVASEEVEPAMGWAYSKFLADLVAKPTQSGADLAKSIVKSYIVDDVRVQDDEARSAFVLENYGIEEEVTAEEVGQELSKDVTLTALNLQTMPAFMEALNEFAFVLTGVDPEVIAKARTYAQSFESVFGEEFPSPYLDLGNFANLVAQLAESDDVNDAVANLAAASKKFIIAEMHGPGRPGATGLTIFFPTPELLVAVGTADSTTSYTGFAPRFAGASLWDDFLVFHYTNYDIDPDLAVTDLLDPEASQGVDITEYMAPLLGEEMTADAPGVDTELAMAPLEVSSEVIATDETVLLGTSISGAEVGYIYMEAALYDEESESYVIIDSDFVAADESAEVDGIFYPLWSEFDLEDFIFEWSPTIYSLSDGESEAFALLEPSVYGASDSDGEYIVRGIFTFADSGQEREAFIRFNGNLEFNSIFGFSGVNGYGAPRAITPNVGDTFTLLEKWIELDEEGNEVVNEYVGDTLTFSGTPFEVIAYEAYAGEYSLGITVTDLAGGQISEYASVIVEEAE